MMRLCFYRFYYYPFQNQEILSLLSLAFYRVLQSKINLWYNSNFKGGQWNRSFSPNSKTSIYDFNMYLNFYFALFSNYLVISDVFTRKGRFMKNRRNIKTYDMNNIFKKHLNIVYRLDRWVLNVDCRFCQFLACKL